MALLSSRLIFQNLRSSYCLVNRSYAKMEKLLPDALDLATGKEKAEMLAHQAGFDDPFKVKSVQRKKHTTKNDPNIVPSFEKSRIVGCICEEESQTIKWMWLHEGEPKRCQCGHWFKLVDYEFPIDLSKHSFP